MMKPHRHLTNRGRVRCPPRVAYIIVVAFSVFIISVLIADPRSLQLFQTTFLLAITCATLAVPIGTFVAWLLVRVELRLRWLLGGLFFVALVLPLYLHAAVWEAGFGQLGWFQLAFRDQQPVLLRGETAAIFVHTLAAIPWAMLFAFAHLRIGQPDLEDVARLDLPPLAACWHVLRVQLTPIMIVSFAWIVVFISGEITVTDLFAVRTFAEEFYLGYAADAVGSESAVLPPFKSAMAFTVTLWSLTMLSLIAYAPHLEHFESRPCHRCQLGRGVGPLVFVALLLAMLTTVVPMVNLVIKAGATVVQEEQQWTRAWSAVKALRMTWESPIRFRNELGWSLLIAQLASLISVLIAGVLLAITNGGRRSPWLVAGVGAFCLAIPGPLLGLWVIWLFQAIPAELGDYLYSRTIAPPCVAMTIKSFPIVLGMLWAGLRMLPADFLDAARVAGATTWQQWVWLVIPNQGMLILCAYLAGTLYGLGDVAASILVMPPGVTTIAISIFSMIHSGAEDRLAALCLAIVALSCILGGGAIWAFRIYFAASNRGRA